MLLFIGNHRSQCSFKTQTELLICKGAFGNKMRFKSTGKSEVGLRCLVAL